MIFIFTESKIVDWLTEYLLKKNLKRERSNMDIEKLHNRVIDILGTPYTIKIVDEIKDESQMFI